MNKKFFYIIITLIITLFIITISILISFVIKEHTNTENIKEHTNTENILDTSNLEEKFINSITGLNDLVYEKIDGYVRRYVNGEFCIYFYNSVEETRRHEILNEIINEFGGKIKDEIPNIRAGVIKLNKKFSSYNTMLDFSEQLKSKYNEIIDRVSLTEIPREPSTID